MNITSAKYVQTDKEENGTLYNHSVLAVIDGLEHLIPMQTTNRHYLAVLEWVAEGNTIQAAS